MALHADLIYEVIMNANYQTTSNLLEIYPKWKTEKLWKDKCTKLYPSKTYLSSFSGQENFLIKERTMVLTIEDNSEVSFSNCLMEYHPILEHQMKIIQGLTEVHMRLIKINIEKQFIVVKHNWDDYDFNIFVQLDSNGECLKLIKDDAKEMGEDCGYYIIDANLFAFDYNKANFIRQEFYLASEYNDKL